jgi:hypothetical protein
MPTLIAPVDADGKIAATIEARLEEVDAVDPAARASSGHRKTPRGGVFP